MAEEPPKKSPKTALRSRAEKEKKKSPLLLFYSKYILCCKSQKK